MDSNIVDLPYFPFIIRGKEFKVEYPLPPHTVTIRQVLDLIYSREEIKGGILNSEECQMYDSELFVWKPFDPARPAYTFEPADDLPLGQSRTPLKSVFSKVPSLPHLLSSPVYENPNEIHQKCKTNLLALRTHSIDLYFGDNKVDTVHVAQITKALTDLTCRDFTILRDEMDLGDDSSPGVDFKLDELMVKTEPTCQAKFLTPLAPKGSDILDTHSSNIRAQFLCCSPASNGVINFNIKPDLIHGKVPILLEVKSRVTEEKLTVKSKVTALKSKAIAEENEQPIPAMATLSLSDRVPKNDITLVELNLFQRCLERILEQAQFRAYLSKLVVLGSTGHTSWCFYYTQNFEGGHYTKRLTVSKIANADVNNVWNGMVERVQTLGSSFYLSNHAPVIAKTLQCLFPTIDLHSIRVNVASVSQSVVYYITPPDIGTNHVTVNNKSFAFKVMSDADMFTREVEKLERIKANWTEYQGFYYITNSDTLFKKLTVETKRNAKYSWFEHSNKDCYDYHVIIMRPAYRTNLLDVVDSTGQIYDELLRSLAVAHKAGVLHCDLSPNNCLQFTDGWQVVDYGLSIDIEYDKEDWMTKYSGYVTIQKNSFQHRCCGHRAFTIVSECDDRNEVDFDWTVADDLAMLQRACSKEIREQL